MAKIKKRLDVKLMELLPEYDDKHIQSWIMQGKVYGVDVGYGDVHEKIRTDERLVLLEKTNLRILESVGELVDVVTLDLSFISVISVMPTVCNILKKDGMLIVLIKPQFEASKHE